MSFASISASKRGEPLAAVVARFTRQSAPPLVERAATKRPGTDFTQPFAQIGGNGLRSLTAIAAGNENRESKKLTSMRTDLLPLCDKDYSAMSSSVAPVAYDSPIEYFRCGHEWCGRCYRKSLGYVTPAKGGHLSDVVNEPCCPQHRYPMFISGIDRQRNVIRYACPEPDCTESFSRR